MLNVKSYLRKMNLLILFDMPFNISKQSIVSNSGKKKKIALAKTLYKANLVWIMFLSYTLTYLFIFAHGRG